MGKKFLELSPPMKLRYEDLLDDWLKTNVQESSVIYGEEQEENPELDSLLLTINPSPSVKVEDFVAKVFSFVERKIISPKVWAYCFEQRSVSARVHGVHAHIVLCDIKPSALKKWAYSTFKNMVGNEKHVDVRRTNYDRAIKYLEGFKKGQEKPTRQRDINFRKKYDLKDIYLCE